MFQRVVPVTIEGATLFGLDLSDLHAKEADPNALRRWVDALAELYEFPSDQRDESRDDAESDECTSEPSFRDLFLSDLRDYCLLVAAYDGRITDDVLDGINALVDDADLDYEDAAFYLNEIYDSGWHLGYPLSFKILVLVTAGNSGEEPSSEDRIIVPGEIYYFYRQVARYVYSIDHSDDFGEKSKARDYVGSFRKYVECASDTEHMYIPEGEDSISQVNATWERLVEGEQESLERNACGRWKGVSGDALSRECLSDLYLSSSGASHMDRKGPLGRMLNVVWKVQMLPGMNMRAPVLFIPELDATVIMQPLGPDRMAATVLSKDPKLNLRMAVYERDRRGDGSATVAKGVPARQDETKASEAPGDTRNVSGPKRKKPWKAIIAVAGAAAIAALFFSAQPQITYEQAVKNYESGQYQKAADAFGGLGDYLDSAERARKASLGVKAKEMGATAGEGPDAWEAVAQAYEQMGDDEGTRAAQGCRDRAAYYRGKQLMGSGRWAEARESFGNAQDLELWDISSLIKECDARMAYDKAEAAFANGSYYDAYVRFSELAESAGELLPDCAERARACVQELPETGVLYVNPDYAYSAVPLTINNGPSDVYIKLYSGEDLAMTLFARSGETVTLGLPAGAYRMNEAHGKQWFGEVDAFGKEGSYFQCTFGGSDEAILEYGYSYEIATSHGIRIDGTGVGSKEIDMESF